MHTLARSVAALLALWLSLSAEPARADDALLTDGRRISGILTLTDKGRLEVHSQREIRLTFLANYPECRIPTYFISP
jgi:hypothetical protein